MGAYKSHPSASAGTRNRTVGVVNAASEASLRNMFAVPLAVRSAPFTWQNMYGKNRVNKPTEIVRLSYFQNGASRIEFSIVFLSRMHSTSKSVVAWVKNSVAGRAYHSQCGGGATMWVRQVGAHLSITKLRKKKETQTQKNQLCERRGKKC